MTQNTIIVFNGFLGLTNPEKLLVVTAINEYFDSNEKEEIRAQADKRFAELDNDAATFACKCCGKRRQPGPRY